MKGCHKLSSARRVHFSLADDDGLRSSDEKGPRQTHYTFAWTNAAVCSLARRENVKIRV
jgi:hypothetical protein